MPRGTATLGRYESWAGVMGGILEVAGVTGFLTGRDRLHAEADKETTEWAALCKAWWSAYESRPITAKDVFEVVKDRGLLLDVWGGRTQQGALQRIGHALGARRDRVFGSYKLIHAGRDGVTRNAAYRLELPLKETPGTPKTPGKAVKRSLETGANAQNLTECFANVVPTKSGDADKTPGGTSTLLDSVNGH